MDLLLKYLSGKHDVKQYDMKRKIKMLLVGFVGLLCLFTLIGLLIPSSVKISRGVIVNADSATVLQQISVLEEWPKWVTWFRSDKGMLVRIQDESDQKVVRWQSLSKEEGGEISLLSNANGELKLLHAFKGMNKANGMLRVRNAGAGQAEVLWMIEYPLRWYPWERFEGIFMDSMIGAALDQALQGLKKYVENAAS